MPAYGSSRRCALRNLAKRRFCLLHVGNSIRFRLWTSARSASGAAAGPVRSPLRVSDLQCGATENASARNTPPDLTSRPAFSSVAEMADNGYRVRRASASDLETLVSFTLQEAREAEGRQLNQESVRRGVGKGLQDPETACYWVLEEAGGRVVGSISAVREWSDWNGAYYWWVQSLFIRPRYRGSDLLPLLLDAVAETARDAGALDLRLLVHSGNQRAVGAYLREGFRKLDYEVMSRPL